jgi:hypothetical protein
MKIKMLSTQNGSIDGIRIASYEAGSVHDLSFSKGERELARAFVAAGMAVEVPPDPPATPAKEQPASAGFFTPADEEKAIESAHENKMLKRQYIRKSKGS